MPLLSPAKDMYLKAWPCLPAGSTTADTPENTKHHYFFLKRAMLAGIPQSS